MKTLGAIAKHALAAKHTPAAKNALAAVILVLAAVMTVSCGKVPEPLPSGGSRPLPDREVVPGLGYQKVMILYSEGYNDLVGNLSLNINQLCEGEIPFYHERNVIVVYSHAAIRRGDYNTETEPVIYRLYTAEGQVRRDTLVTFDPMTTTMTTSFVRGVMETIRNTFPSKHYGLVITSHGNGWIPGDYTGENFDMSVAPFWIGAEYDGSYLNRKSLDITQLRTALPFRLDYIAFDACLMGGVEVAYELKDVCDYLVASPTEVISDGFNYQNMAARLLSDGEPDLQGLCEDYFNMCVGSRSYATIGLYDCSKMQALADVCKPIFESHRDEVFSVNPYSVQSYNYSFNYNFDFRDYVKALHATEEELKALDAALDELVIYKNATPYFITTPIDPERFSGIGTYIPRSGTPTLNSCFMETAWNEEVHLLK